MRIRVKAYVYNDKLLAERERLGLTQVQFAGLCGITPQDYAAIETLKSPQGDIRTVRDKLIAVANAAFVEFDELFPPDYLQMLVDNKLPRRRKPFVFTQEISLDALPPPLQALALPDPMEIAEGEIITQQIQEDMRKVISQLSSRHQQVLTLRFGLDGGKPKTLEECAKQFHVTRERIRQTEAEALRLLRHPRRSRSLRGFFIADKKPHAADDENQQEP